MRFISCSTVSSRSCPGNIGAVAAFERSLPWADGVGFAVRDAVRVWLRGRLPVDVLHDVELVATELATNAYLHGTAVADDGIELRIDLDGEVIRVVVIDGGAGFEPDWDATSAPAIGGLRLVDSIAVAWGVDGDDGSTAVWAEVPKTAAGN
jgi:two-component sensor histidine kinase